MSLTNAIKTGVRSGLLNTMVSTPAIVDSFDPENQTIKANIAIMRIVDGENKPYSLLIDIPILLPTVQGFHLTMPIKKSDEVLLIFADRCIDDWFINGGVEKQAEHRIHDISDGFAIIGVNSEPNVITDYSSNDMVIRNTANNQKITMRASGDIDIETTTNINVSCVDLVVDASGSATITTPQATINAEVEINGNTQMNGTLDVTGAINSGSLMGSPSILADGVELKSHTHGGVQTGSSNTSPVS